MTALRSLLSVAVTELAGCSQRLGQLEQQRVERLAALGLLADPRERGVLTDELLRCQQRLLDAAAAVERAQEAVDALLDSVAVDEVEAA